jgi:hypothetical protein
VTKKRDSLLEPKFRRHRITQRQQFWNPKTVQGFTPLLD